MEVGKMIFLSKWVIYRFHVNLPGCTLSISPRCHSSKRLETTLHRTSRGNLEKHRWQQMKQHDSRSQTIGRWQISWFDIKSHLSSYLLNNLAHFFGVLRKTPRFLSGTSYVVVDHRFFLSLPKWLLYQCSQSLRDGPNLSDLIGLCRTPGRLPWKPKNDGLEDYRFLFGSFRMVYFQGRF